MNRNSFAFPPIHCSPIGLVKSQTSPSSFSQAISAERVQVEDVGLVLGDKLTTLDCVLVGGDIIVGSGFFVGKGVKVGLNDIMVGAMDILGSLESKNDGIVVVCIDGGIDTVGLVVAVGNGVDVGALDSDGASENEGFRLGTNVGGLLGLRDSVKFGIKEAIRDGI